MEWQPGQYDRHDKVLSRHKRCAPSSTICCDPTFSYSIPCSSSSPTSPPLTFSSSNVSNHGILLPKLFLPTVRKNCSSDGEIFLKFEAEGREFLRSLEQFIQTVKGQNNFLVTECFFNLFLEVSHI